MKTSSSSEYPVRAKAELPAHGLVQTPHASGFCSCCSRPLSQPGSSPAVAAAPGQLRFASLPWASTRLHKPLLTVEGGVQISLTQGSIPHRQLLPLWGREGWVSLLGLHPSRGSTETPHRLLSQWAYPASAHLLIRKGTWVIGETLLMVTYFIFYTNRF